ncbi:helix-turn-helix transcriptional regulator [Methylobacterium sp. WL30]|uniref:helix-turn-helix transcriptional regulator n=1 Tax=unclassified Methylobacterium TaxID=2615210 RepID=UPI0011C995AF|nr:MULTISPECIES: helix-turn-helix transcriptional regulator [unclassified Methylobacterium]TXN40651.1 helix-turn-helix transcriptional regulator [Methylobacterium sp. WL93]TXN49975.1 helix-turn-helix transcriptional regulator [Methylobacterium sp. WL119]TXN62984.1 helix-turn-helix transcriptional regulator [Methylobacterium sp. WL30]
MIYDEKAISGAQCRAARALLDWTREDLARESKVSRATIADYETGKRPARERTTDDLRQALEAGGIEFTPENGGGAGVRFRERSDAKPDEGLRPDQLTSENDGGAEG